MSSASHFEGPNNPVMSIADAVGDPRVRVFVCQLCKQTNTQHRCGRQKTICNACYLTWRTAQSRARVAIQRAVRKKILPHPKTLLCVDCGRAADGYEHRSYDRGKELDVVAICGVCNHRRGPASLTETPEKNLPKAFKTRLFPTPAAEVLDCAAITLMGAA